MQFKDILGQEKVKKSILTAVHKDRVPHALMLKSKEGNGNLPMAIAFSAYLNCANRTEEDSCGTCPSCSKHKQLIHPDMHFVFPTFNKTSTPATTNDFLPEFRELVKENLYANTEDWREKIGADNKALNINTKQCHDMIKTMSLKSFEGGYKTMILWMPEYLKEQGNILLKMIEEPTPRTLFILCTSDTEMVLTTIVSRTQLVQMEIPSQEVIQENLSEKFGLQDSLANNIALLADGNINRAYKLVNKIENSHFPGLREWFQTCFKGNAGEMSKVVNTMSTLGREELKSFMQYGMHIVRACVVHPHGVNKNKLTGDENVFVKNLSPFFQASNGDKAYAVFNNSLFWLERNGNVKIVLFDLSLELQKIFKKK